MELASWDTSPYHRRTSFCISVIYMYIDTHIHMGKDWMDPVYRSTRFIEMLTPDKYLILDPVYRSIRSIEMLTPDKYLIYVNISIGLEFPMHWNQTCSLSLSHLIYHSYLFVYFIPCGLACTLLKTRFIEDKWLTTSLHLYERLYKPKYNYGDQLISILTQNPVES